MLKIYAVVALNAAQIRLETKKVVCKRIHSDFKIIWGNLIGKKSRTKILGR